MAVLPASLWCDFPPWWSPWSSAGLRQHVAMGSRGDTWSDGDKARSCQACMGTLGEGLGLDIPSWPCARGHGQAGVCNGCSCVEPGVGFCDLYAFLQLGILYESMILVN